MHVNLYKLIESEDRFGSVSYDGLSDADFQIKNDQNSFRYHEETLVSIKKIQNSRRPCGRTPCTDIEHTTLYKSYSYTFILIMYYSA